jgi:hypothetical protein
LRVFFGPISGVETVFTFKECMKDWLTKSSSKRRKIKMKFRKFLFLMLTFTALVAVAQTEKQGPVEKILTVETNNGAKQSGVLSVLSNAAAPSILVAIIPGHPVLAKASVSFTGKVMIKQDASFVVRERLRLLDQDIATLVIDCRSDFGTACDDNYQMTEERFLDIRPLMDLAKANFPAIKRVWVLSTSRGYFTSAAISKYSSDYFEGVIHTSGVVDMVLKYPDAIKKTATPQFFVHHADDPCKFTQYATAKNMAEKVEAPMITVFGGSGFYGGACQAHTQHGFKGMEEKVMSNISNIIKTGSAEKMEIR